MSRTKWDWESKSGAQINRQPYIDQIKRYPDPVQRQIIQQLTTRHMFNGVNQHKGIIKPEYNG